MAVILQRETLDLNFIQLNSTKKAFRVLISTVKPGDTKMSKAVLALKKALSPGEKGNYYMMQSRL